MDRTNEELCLLIQSGNQEAKQDICIKNKRLVSKVAAKYFDTYGNTLEIEDLEQVGYLGLLTAADKFSVDRDVKFSTYAVHWIKREMMREISDHGFAVKIPARTMDKIAKCINLETSFMQDGLTGKERVQAIADTLDMTISEVEKYLAMREKYFQNISLNIYTDEDNTTMLSDEIVDESLPLPGEEMECSDCRKMLLSAISGLNPQEQKIVKYRYGFIGDKPYSIAELSTKLNLGEERIRQVEELALRKLKYMMKKNDATANRRCPQTYRDIICL